MVNGGVCVYVYVFMTHDSEFQKKLLRYEFLLLLQKVSWPINIVLFRENVHGP